jgi:predicted nicotinamide N-methyase
MPKFETIKAGDVLYQRARRKMGNTTQSRLEEWPVRVIEVFPARRAALVSWNGNTPKTMYALQLEKLYRSRIKRP